MLKQSLYDIDKTYLYNLVHGPFYAGEVPNFAEIPKDPGYIFGHKLNNRLGVPAGPLLGSRWVSLAASFGYSFLTYKTIRSTYHPSHPLPNVSPVDLTKGIALSKSMDEIKGIKDLSITNSFGMPSMSLDFLSEDIPRAMRSLEKGQILAVSITGQETQERSFVQDLCYLVQFLKELEVPIIEVNFSCPNISGGATDLYLDPESIYKTGKELTKIAGGTPLIIKVGHFEDERLLEEVLFSVARAGFKGVCGINSLKREVRNSEGLYAYGRARAKSGICGAGIYDAACSFLRSSDRIIKKLNLDLSLIGTGGVVTPEDFEGFFEAGAQLALTATGMMWDPTIAMRYLKQKEGYTCTEKKSSYV